MGDERKNMGVFQSTPPAEARGDDRARILDELELEVSIHSPAEARGDGHRDGYAPRQLQVSIHSPRRSEGRLR